MKKVWAILVMIASIPFITVGILFLIAAAARGSRILPALALGAIGVALLLGGFRWLRRLATIAPDALKTGAVELARRFGGELTVSRLRAEYRIPNELAQRVLDDLVDEGVCTRESRGERDVYVVTGLLPSISQKLCPYCGADLPLRSTLRKCPNCGAQLEITKT